MTSSPAPRRSLPGWVTALLWLVALVAVPLLIDQWRHRDAPDTLPPQVLLELDGTRLDLQQMSRDQPVLVYFWATWCPICRLVSPSVDALRDTHPVVSIAMSSGTPEQVADYAAEHELGFRIVNDPDGHISRAWGVGVTPTLAVVHRGEIRSMTSGVTTPPGISLRLWMSGLLGAASPEIEPSPTLPEQEKPE
ncbi:protein disulfide oxidoreductase [Haliea sp. E1-2-M8]|uniref:protein disulfide oxidoreductase n=1 Tax=Haliea sp. E1-2-M8 TaxID=3064706 RepID=UPI00271C1F33|nr:protein disulfide oxidoreductase [Haliea sp. E1-2-M8]MDO8861837.1 protein disulfide oxidoreductase [Haliea sp. E1-2-M8]